MIPDGYRGYDELLHGWSELATRGMMRRVVGTSVDGVALDCFEIGPRDAKIASVAMAGVHALEWIGPHVLLAVAGELAKREPARRLLFFPVVNVDGYRAVESDLLSRRARWRRGNTRGVDLNRNWPTHFRARTLASTLLPFVYRSGKAPRSEPEVDAIVAALDDVAARGVAIERAVSLHSIGRKILYPWGGRWRAPQARDRLESAALAMRAAFREPYDVVQCARWVPGAFAHGMELDHLHAAYGATSLLVEISRGGFRWSEPQTYLAPFRWFNPPEPDTVAAELVPGLCAFLTATE